MKKEIKGKYAYSKIEETTFTSNSPEEMLEASEYFGVKNPKEWRAFDNVILGATERATAILSKANLPVSPNVKWTDNSEETKKKNRIKDLKADDISKKRGLYCGDPIVERGSESSGSLRGYVIGYLKYEHDSIEGLAARILTTIELLKTPEQKDNISMLIFELGELTTLLKINAIKRQGGKTGKEGCGKKQWAVDLAEYLIKEYPDSKFPELWEMIKKEADGINGVEATVKGEKEYLTCYKEDVTDNEIEKNSFRTGYISPIKNKK